MSAQGQPDILKRLNAFTERANAAVENLKRTQDRLNELVPRPEVTSVTAEVEPDGRLVDLQITRGARMSLSAEELAREIVAAVGLATAERDALGISAVKADAARAGIDVHDLITRLFDQAQSGGPETYWTPQRTVGIVMIGTLVHTIEFNMGWLEASTESAIENEVMRAATDAWRQAKGEATNG